MDWKSISIRLAKVSEISISVKWSHGATAEHGGKRDDYYPPHTLK
jgi:hypothetical protein